MCAIAVAPPGARGVPSCVWRRPQTFAFRSHPHLSDIIHHKNNCINGLWWACCQYPSVFFRPYPEKNCR